MIFPSARGGKCFFTARALEKYVRVIDVVVHVQILVSFKRYICQGTSLDSTFQPKLSFPPTQYMFPYG